MAEGFTANISRPESVTGSIPTHESIGSVVGGALGGMAKILDVGLKASAEARQDRVLKQVDDQLYSEVNGWGPKAPGPILVGEKPEVGDQAAMDSAPGVGSGMKKIDNLMAASRQGGMRTAEVMGRASVLVQQMIHDHPRFADAIRERAQKILGTNPTEAMIRLNENDEAMRREGDFRLQQAGIEAYQKTGGIMPITADGQIDRPAAYALGQQAQAAEYKLDTTNKELERDLKQQELYMKEHPAETETQFHQRIQAKMHATIDEIARPQMETAFNNLLNSDMLAVSQTIGDLSTAESAKKSIALQTGLSANKAQVMAAIDRALDKLPPDERVAADKKAVREYYEDLFKPWEDLAKGPLSSFEVMTRAAATLKDKYNVDVFTSAPQLSALKALIGDQALGELVNQQFLSDTALGKQADVAVHNFLTNVMHVSDGSQKTIPDAATAKGTKAVLNQYAKDPSQLGKVELANYHNTASAWVQSGMAYDAGQPGQVQAIASGVLAPDKLAVFDQHAKENPGDAKVLGPQLLTLAQHNIEVQGAAAMTSKLDTSMRNRMIVGPNGQMERHNINYGIQYNPTSGKFEIKVTDEKGKDLSGSSLTQNRSVVLGGGGVALTLQPNSRYPNGVNVGTKSVNLPSTTIATGSELPSRLIQTVNGMNESMAAMVHLKSYGNDTDVAAKEDEYKLNIVQGANIPVKEGALMPSQKKDTQTQEKPAASQAESSEKVPGNAGVMIDQVAEDEGVDPNLAHALAMSESSGSQAAKSKTGVKGLFQVTEATAKEMGVNRDTVSGSIIGGIRYLHKMLDQFDGDIGKAVLAYKIGPNHVQDAKEHPDQYSDYIAGTNRVLKAMKLPALVLQ